jgi:hypothetical protein
MSERQAMMPVSILAWKSVKKNSLRGFAEVRIGAALKVVDVAVHASNGKRWAQLPSRPQIDSKTGEIIRKDGKIQYAPMIQWLDRTTADRFSEAVIAGVEAQSPGDTDAG